MYEGGAIDGANDGHLDLQEILQQILAFFVNAVPVPGVDFPGPGDIHLSEKLVAGSSEYDHPVLWIAADAVEEIAEFRVNTVGRRIPDRGAPPVVDLNLQNAVAAIETDVLVCIRIGVEIDHSSLP